MFPQQNNIKNLGSLSFEHLKQMLEDAEAWQITGGMFDKILGKSTDGKSIEEIFISLNEKYKNQLLKIKAGKVDAKGILAQTAPVFCFYMPETLSIGQSDVISFDLFQGSNVPLFNTPQQNNQSNNMPVILNGLPNSQPQIQQPVTDLNALLGQLELKSQNQLNELKNFYESKRIEEDFNRKIEEIERKYIDAETKFKEAEELKAKYEDRLSKYIPNIGDLLGKVISTVMDKGLDAFTGKKTILSGAENIESKEVKQGSAMTFKIKGTETEKKEVDVEKTIISGLTETQKAPKKLTKEEILEGLRNLEPGEIERTVELIQDEFCEEPEKEEKENTNTTEEV